ncbi:thioredoxin [Quadrisphaera sp. GCM10027208]|uniref:thioredoxin n=1 Tax=Quadrisphaera sp. GCM10027208 TaxID=3273423 RepID=UPI0036090CC6|nr:thioredoxin [Kineosporiaceae bacterium SCSIO 59966]
MATAEASIVTCPSCGKRNRVASPTAGRARCAVCHADLPRLVVADDATFDEVVVDSSVPVLVDLWAPWCGPCRAIAPVLEQVAVDYAGRLKVAKVNADESPQVSARHQVTAIPTLLLYRGGSEVARTVGALPPPQLRAWLDGALREAPSPA